MSASNTALRGINNMQVNPSGFAAGEAMPKSTPIGQPRVSISMRSGSEGKLLHGESDYARDYDQKTDLLQRFALDSPAYAKVTGFDSNGEGLDRYSLSKHESFQSSLAMHPINAPHTQWYDNVWRDDAFRYRVTSSICGMLSGLAGGMIVDPAPIGFAAAVQGGLAGCAFGVAALYAHAFVRNKVPDNFSLWGSMILSVGTASAISVGVSQQSGLMGAGDVGVYWLLGLSVSVGVPTLRLLRANLSKRREEELAFVENSNLIMTERNELVNFEERKMHALQPETIQNKLAENLELQREFYDKTLRAEFRRLKVETESNRDRIEAVKKNLEARYEERKTQFETKSVNVPYDLILELQFKIKSLESLLHKINAEVSGYDLLLEQIKTKLAEIDAQLSIEVSNKSIADDYELIGQSEKAREIIARSQFERLELLKSLAEVSREMTASALGWHKTRLEIARDIEVAEARVKNL